MKRLIGACGLDCEKCDAFRATRDDDEALKEKTAKRWSEINHADITPAMIACQGCLGDGVKTPYCASLCEIRKCAVKKGFSTCGECLECARCALLSPILSTSEDARANLKTGK